MRFVGFGTAKGWHNVSAHGGICCDRDRGICSVLRSGIGSRLSGELYRINLGTVQHDTVTLSNASLADCIRFAYGLVSDAQLSGPGWITSKELRYDIVAKTPPDTPQKQVLKMMQALLTERFKLALHRDHRNAIRLRINIPVRVGLESRTDCELPRCVDVAPQILALLHCRRQPFGEIPSSVISFVDHDLARSVNVTAITDRDLKQTIVKFRSIITVGLQRGWNDDAPATVNVARPSVLHEAMQRISRLAARYPDPISASQANATAVVKARISHLIMI